MGRKYGRESYSRRELAASRAEIDKDIGALAIMFSNNGWENPGNIYLIEQMLRFRLSGVNSETQDEVIAQALSQFAQKLAGSRTRVVGKHVRVEIAEEKIPGEEIEKAQNRVGELQAAAQLDYELIEEGSDPEGFREELEGTIAVLKDSVS